MLIAHLDSSPPFGVIVSSSQLPLIDLGVGLIKIVKLEKLPKT